MGGSDGRTVVFCTSDVCYREVELGAVIFFPTYFPLQPHYSYFTQLAVETVNQPAFPRQAYPSDNKASINNPLTSARTEGYYPKHLFHPGPERLQPQVMQQDSNLSLGAISQLHREESCLCNCMCLLVHIGSGGLGNSVRP